MDTTEKEFEGVQDVLTVSPAEKSLEVATTVVGAALVSRQRLQAIDVEQRRSDLRNTVGVHRPRIARVRLYPEATVVVLQQAVNAGPSSLAEGHGNTAILQRPAMSPAEYGHTPKATPRIG